jgi:hypothetical protein
MRDVIEGEPPLQGGGEGAVAKGGTLITCAPEESHGGRAETRLVIPATIAPAP